MKSPSSRARTWGLAVLACVFAAWAAGCGSPAPTGPLTDRIASTLSDPNFEVEGPITGSMTITTQGTTLTWTMTGRQQTRGHDNATYVTMTMAGQTTTSDEVEVGQWKYERHNAGPWTRSPRSGGGAVSSAAPAATAAASVTQESSGKPAATAPPSIGSWAEWLSRVGGLVDKGTDTHYDRELHRLEPSDPAATLPGLNLGVEMTDPSMNVTLWANDDGSLAGTTMKASWKQGTSLTGSIIWDVAVEKTSGVQIDVPGGFDGPATTSYSAADQLRRNLAAMETASGKVTGRLKIGSQELALNGTVAFQGADSSIELTTGTEKPRVFDEIVAGGIRYTSPDGRLWVNKGRKPAGAGISSLLAGAQTITDAGVEEIGGKQEHRIVSGANTLDVATALGLDLPAVSGPSSQLWIWADDSGRPAGFGATISWGRVIDGQPTSSVMELEVLFDSSPVSISAPKNAWKWIVDNESGIALALPANWVAGQRTSAGYVTYRDPTGVATLSYVSQPATLTTEQIRTQWIRDLTLKVDSRYNNTVDGQTALSLMAHASALDIQNYVIDLNRVRETYFVIMTVAPGGTYVYGLAFWGTSARKVALETLSDQIQSTVEFLK